MKTFFFWLLIQDIVTFMNSFSHWKHYHFYVDSITLQILISQCFIVCNKWQTCASARDVIPQSIPWKRLTNDVEKKTHSRKKRCLLWCCIRTSKDQSEGDVQLISVCSIEFSTHCCHKNWNIMVNGIGMYVKQPRHSGENFQRKLNEFMSRG